MTHLWPTSDTFDGGSPAFDNAFVTAYTRMKVVNNDPAFGSGGSGYGISTFFTNAHQLYDGWGGASNTLPGSSALIGGWLWRVAEVADCQAAITYSLVANSSLIETTPRRFMMGVGCRVQAGTLTSGGTQAAYHDIPSGYYAVALYDPFVGGSFGLWRVTTGTIARLHSTSQSPAMSWAAMGVTTSRQLKLVCTTNGSGDVELELWTNPTPGATPILVLSVVDNAVGKLTGAGRCGFFSSLERTDAGIRAAPVLTSFELGPDSADPTVRDEWVRLNSANAHSVSGALNAGRVLTSSFYGDLWGVSTFQGLLRENTTTNRAVIDTLAAEVDRHFLSQRPADDPIYQDRVATIRFAGGTTIPNPCIRSAGVTLRATMPATTLIDGYLAVAKRDDQADVGWIELYRTKDRNPVLLAEKTSVTLTMNTEYTLRLIVENLTIPDPVNGYVRLRVYLGGVQVALVGVGADSVSVNGAGTVTDTSDDRVLSGAGEGFYMAGPTGSNRNVGISLWDAGGPITPVELAPEDQDSVAVPSETAGATGTLVLPFDWEIQEEIDVNGQVVDEFEADYSQRWLLADGTSTTWRIKASVLTEDEADEFQQFWEDHKGAEIPFNWVPPDYDASIICRFVVDESGKTHRAPVVFAIGNPVELVIEQVGP